MPAAQVQMKELVSHQGFPMYLLMNLTLSKSLGNDDDQVHDDQDDEEQDDVNELTDSDNDGDGFVHSKLSTHDEEDKEEEDLDPRVHTPSNANVEGEEMDEEETNEEDEANELYRDTVNEQLEAKVLTRSSNESKTYHAVAANLSELELKKILIDKMESNKSIHRSDEQKNLYKALVDAYKSDKIILDTYKDNVSFKRHRDDEDKDEEPFTGSNRGSKSHQKSADESAQAEEPMHNVKDLGEPTHQEFETRVTEDQPVAETSYFLDWFQKPDKLPSPDRDWNKTLPAVHESTQPWLSNLARKEDPRKSFDELIDTPLDFSAFVMNRLNVDTLTPELLASPTFELMKGTCFIYQKKDKKNRLMRIDELHKFSDGTLNDVRTALDDRLKGIWMKYLPQTIWRQSDKDKAGAMIQAIDKQLKTRRIIRSLEKFVGGRPYKGEFWLLQRTI
ncbi:hypothetical protein Tco_0178483 [Tanacetum coccineum]